MKARLLGFSILAMTTMVALLASGVPIDAQSGATLKGPVLGYVFSSPEKALRPLRGVLGSTTVGDPVDLGFAVSQALVLDERYAVVSTEAHSELVLLDLGVSPALSVLLSGAPANATRMVASARAASAALYYSDSGQVLIVTGLPRNPLVTRSVVLSNAHGAMTQIAVNDDGTLLVYAISEGHTESLYRWTPNIDGYLSSAVTVGGIALTSSGSAVVADRGANEVFVIGNVGDMPNRQFLAGEWHGVSSPSGVVVSPEGLIYVANVGSSSIMSLDFSGHVLAIQQCRCSPSGLYRLRQSTFRVTDGLDQTLYLLDTRTVGGSIWFAPPLRMN